MVTPIRLHPLYCTLYLCTLTLTSQHLQALVAFSLAFVSDSFRFNSTVCTSLAATLQALFTSNFTQKSTNFLFHSFCWKLAGATTALSFEHVRFLTHILLYCCQFFLHSF
jgi:hypothetical protein